MNAAKSRKIFLMVAIPAFLLAFGLSALRTFIIPKLYASTAEIELQGLPSQGDISLLIQKQAALLQSDVLLSKVADRLNLNAAWGKKIKLDGIMNTWEAVLLLKRQVEVIPIWNRHILAIRFSDDDKNETALIANEIAQTYCAVAAQTTHAIRAVVHSRAVPASHPSHPNIPLRLFIGAIAAVIFAIGMGGVAAWIKLRLDEATPETFATANG